jgi:alpha-D-ribose 1-methylphosphonate 5-triphosphate synthase subunit PhnG
MGPVEIAGQDRQRQSSGTKATDGKPMGENSHNNVPHENGPRQRAMGAVAAADRAFLEAAWDGFAARPEWSWLRKPESGLVMVRGRTGGGGTPFNLGEVTVTRCAVSLATGEAGFAWVMGRDAEKARLAALFDALWQRDDRRSDVEELVVRPALMARDKEDRESAERTAATRVDFFTMVRGEDAE